MTHACQGVPRTENIESESVSPVDIAHSVGWRTPPGAGPFAALAASPEGVRLGPSKPAPALGLGVGLLRSPRLVLGSCRLASIESFPREWTAQL